MLCFEKGGRMPTNETFNSLLIDERGDGLKGGLVKRSFADIKNSGNVLIKAHYSSLNYKDALAATGRGKILRKVPLVGGIDVAGEVISSGSDSFKEGDRVVVTGCGLGEISDGGYSEYLRVPSEWVVPLPEGLSLFDAMALGTAGFTAGLCVERLLTNDQTPEKGPIVVTGATGGVGSVVINILSALGFSTLALTSRPEHASYLKSIGATEVSNLADLKLQSRPLAKARFGGVVDNVGGSVLSSLLPHVNLWGNVASIGLALDPGLNTTVMPFILRGVGLLGISSVNCPMELRKKVWDHLASDWKPKMLKDVVTATVPLTEILPWFDKILNRKIHGRVVVDCRA